MTHRDSYDAKRKVRPAFSSQANHASEHAMWANALNSFCGMMVAGLVALAMLIAPIACIQDCGSADDAAIAEISAEHIDPNHMDIDGDDVHASCCSTCSVHVFFGDYVPELFLVLLEKNSSVFAGGVLSSSPDGPFRPPRVRMI